MQADLYCIAVMRHFVDTGVLSDRSSGTTAARQQCCRSAGAITRLVCMRLTHSNDGIVQMEACTLLHHGASEVGLLKLYRSWIWHKQRLVSSHVGLLLNDLMLQGSLA